MPSRPVLLFSKFGLVEQVVAFIVQCGSFRVGVAGEKQYEPAQGCICKSMYYPLLVSTPD